MANLASNNAVNNKIGNDVIELRSKAIVIGSTIEKCFTLNDDLLNSFWPKN
jgi:hypothetical protein